MPGLIYPDAEAMAILTSLTTTSGKLFGAKLHTFSNNYTPTHLTKLGDLTESTYSGYPSTPPTITWSTVYLNATAQAQSDGNLTSFTGTGAGTPTIETVYGAYLLDGTGALIGAERFASPIPNMGATGSGFSYAPSVLLQSKLL